MNWQLVARKDVGDAIRQYHLHASVLLTVLLFTGVTYVTTRQTAYTTVDPGDVAFALLGVSTFLVPILAIAFSQGIVVEMRTRGDLKLLLGMPFSRRDVVLGSFAGRTTLVLGSVFAGFGVSLLLAILQRAPLSFGALVPGIGIVAILGVVFVSITVGVSAATTTSTRSGALSLGAYFLFVFQLWDRLPSVVLYVINGFRFPREQPDWVDFLGHLNPVLAFRDLIRHLLPGMGDFWGSLPSVVPFYRTAPFVVALLALWIVLPLAFGYRRFDGADL